MRNLFKTTRFQLGIEKPGVIAPTSTWVFIDHIYGYMYLDESFFGLVKQCVKEWRDDRHLVG